MDKELLIQEAIEELKIQTTYVIEGGDYLLGNEKYKELDSLDDIEPYFDKLDNITKFLCINIHLGDFIFDSLCKFKNLNSIYFHYGSPSETEEYLSEGLRKFNNLESLHLAGTELTKFPTFLMDNFHSLPKLSIVRNKFYKQNFHCSFTITDNFYEKLLSFLNVKLFLPEFQNRRILYKNVIIMQDDNIQFYSGLMNSVSVYVLNESELDRYHAFTTFYNLFKEFNDTVGGFGAIGSDDFDLCFFYEDVFNSIRVEDAIYLEDLKALQKSGEIKYKKNGNEYFVSDLLTYLGGEQLITDITNEQVEKDKEISTQFFTQNHLIESIEIKNFKSIEQQKIENMGNINIVVGKNGAGKTSFLQAIAAALIPHKSSDLKNYSTYINIALKGKPENLFFARTHVKWKHFEKAQRIFRNSLEPEVLNKQMVDIPQTYLVLAYGENLYAQKHPFKEQKSDYQDILANGMHKWHHTESIFAISYEYMVNPLDLLYELSEGRIKQQYQEQKHEIIQLAKIISDKLNVFLSKASEQKFSIKQDGVFYKFLNTETNYFVDFEQISEGYRSYIILVSDIIMRILAARHRLVPNNLQLSEIFNKVKGAIIIDEFDKHMHPSWQRTFLQTLKEEFPNIQFVLSTHNIVSLQSAEGEKIFVMSVENGKVSIKDGNIPIGYSIEALYEYYFDEHAYSVKITEKLSRFKEHRNKILATKDFSIMKSEEFIELSNQLSQTNSQLATFVNIELFQLDKYKNNAQTN